MVPLSNIRQADEIAREDVSTYGFYAMNDTKSFWNYTGATLSEPTLNISAFYIDGSSGYEHLEATYDDRSSVYTYRDYYGHDWVNPQTGTQPFNDWTKIAYAYNNITYDRNYILEGNHGVCQPQGVSIGNIESRYYLLYLATLQH